MHPCKRVLPQGHLHSHTVATFAWLSTNYGMATAQLSCTMRWNCCCHHPAVGLLSGTYNQYSWASICAIFMTVHVLHCSLRCQQRRLSLELWQRESNLLRMDCEQSTSRLCYIPMSACHCTPSHCKRLLFLNSSPTLPHCHCYPGC